MIRIRSSHDRERTRAQSLVEYAVIVPVFFLILLGMLELGFAFSHHLTMEYATREGARTGAALANGSDDFPCNNVDQQIIAAVQRVLTASGSQVNLNQIQSIRIFKAGANGQELGPVNVWIRGSTAAALPNTPAVGFQKSNPQSWNACSRNNAANPDSHRRVLPLHVRLHHAARRPDGRHREPHDPDERQDRDGPQPDQPVTERAAAMSTDSTTEPRVRRTTAKRQRSRGQVLVIFAGAIFLMMMLMAIVIDVSWYWVNSLRAQRAADAAALAGAVMLPQQVPSAYTLARQEATKNGFTQGVNGVTEVFPQQDNGNPRRLNVRIQARIGTFFMRVIGIPQIPIIRYSTAEFTPPVPMGSPQNYYGVGILDTASQDRDTLDRKCRQPRTCQPRRDDADGNNGCRPTADDHADQSKSLHEQQRLCRTTATLTSATGNSRSSSATAYSTRVSRSRTRSRASTSPSTDVRLSSNCDSTQPAPCRGVVERRRRRVHSP